MFHLIRNAFLTVVKAFRPVLGQPKKLSWITLAPVVTTLVALYTVVPFIQGFIPEPQLSPMAPTPFVDRLAYRLAGFASDMIALIPWLWLASVLMMKWPQIRHTSAVPEGTFSVLRHPRIGASTVLMFLICLALAVPFELFVQWNYHTAEMSEHVTFTSNGSPAVVALALGLVILSLYGMAFHGMATGQPITVRECRQRHRGRSFRLFVSFLVLVLVTRAFIPSSSLSWGSDFAQRAASDEYVGGFMINSTDLSPVIEVFMFAFVVCAISEVIARAYSTSQLEATKAPGRPASVPA